MFQVDGQWGQWVGWRCHGKCGNNRERFCDTPPPEYGGEYCHGNDSENTSDVCNEQDPNGRRRIMEKNLTQLSQY